MVGPTSADRRRSGIESAELVHDNERRWRVSRERTEQVVRAMTADEESSLPAG